MNIWFISRHSSHPQTRIKVISMSTVNYSSKFVNRFFAFSCEELRFLVFFSFIWTHSLSVEISRKRKRGNKVPRIFSAGEKISSYFLSDWVSGLKSETYAHTIDNSNILIDCPKKVGVVWLVKKYLYYSPYIAHTITQYHVVDIRAVWTTWF